MNTWRKEIEETGRITYTKGGVVLKREYHTECFRQVYYIFVNGKAVGTEWLLKDAKRVAEETYLGGTEK